MAVASWSHAQLPADGFIAAFRVVTRVLMVGRKKNSIRNRRCASQWIAASSELEFPLEQPKEKEEKRNLSTNRWVNFKGPSETMAPLSQLENGFP